MPCWKKPKQSSIEHPARLVIADSGSCKATDIVRRCLSIFWKQHQLIISPCEPFK